MDRDREYCMGLQEQQVRKQQQKQCDYEETLIEKRMNDDVMRTIADEDQRELRHKHEQTEMMRNEMITSQKARVDWKEKQKEMVVIEDRKIEQQRQDFSDRGSAIIAERERKVQLRDESDQKIATKMLANEAARQDREDVISQLQEQEYLEKTIQSDIAERANFERAKSDTKQGLLSQMEYKKNREKEEKEREVDFRKSADLKRAEEDEEEEERKLKLKEKNDQYYADLQQQIKDNAARRKKDREDEINRDKNEFEHDYAWRKEVSEERKKIMEDHVPNLLGYVQPGVISRADLCNPRLANLGIEFKTTSKKPKRFPKCNAQCRILREY